MIGMAVGMAALSAYGSTTITSLHDQIYGSGDGFKQYVPAYLRDRSINDGLVAQALEQWAATKAATIMVGIFLLAAAVTLIAIVPALVLRVRHVQSGSIGDAEEESTYAEVAF